MPEFTQAARAADQRPSFQVEPLQIGFALRLRSWAADARDSAVMFDGHALPTKVGAVLVTQERILSIGPSEWMVFAEARNAASYRESIELQARRQGVAVADQTDAFTAIEAIEASGRQARETLSREGVLGLNPGAFVAGRCARTRLASIPVLVDCVDDSPRFRLYVNRSHAAFVHSRLLNAAEELKARTA